MNGKLPLLLALIAVCFAACATEQGGQTPLVWKDKSDSSGGDYSGGDTGPAAPPEEAAPGSGSSEKVTVEHEVIEELMAILNAKQVITGDLVEIDASIVPFQIAVVPVADPAYVEKTDISSKERKTQGLRLRSRIARPTLMRDFPHVRMGDGIDVMGTREIRVNLYMKVTRQRPMFLRIRGTGHASYFNSETGQRIEAEQVTLYTEVVLKGDGTHQVNKRIL